MVLGNILGGFITIVIGVNLLPIVANGIASMSNASVSNVTGASYTILSLTTLFFALGVMTISIGVAVQGLKSAGLV